MLKFTVDYDMFQVHDKSVCINGKYSNNNPKILLSDHFFYTFHMVIWPFNGNVVPECTLNKNLFATELTLEFSYVHVTSVL